MSRVTQWKRGIVYRPQDNTNGLNRRCSYGAHADFRATHGSQVAQRGVCTRPVSARCSPGGCLGPASRWGFALAGRALISARNSFAVAVLVAALAQSCALSVAARAQDAPAPRQIAPDRFAPTPRELTHAETTRAPIVSPTRERPLGGCDRAARDWLTCLDVTAQLADRAVDDAEKRVLDGLDRRPRLNAVRRQGLAKAVEAADEAWRTLRERECGELVTIENGMTGAVYEAGLLCRIRRDLERAEALTSRYGEAP